MYTRQQASQLKQEFWTTFGQYMSPVRTEEGTKVNWVNYKTGEKDIYFRMHADNKEAFIAIELTHKDPEIRELYFEQFIQLKNIFEGIMGEDWLWQMHSSDNDGRIVSRIMKECKNVNIFNKAQWPDLISFFKTRIIKLDEFWSNVKYGFESLR